MGRLADREPGLPARTAARRLSLGLGLTAYLIAPHTPAQASPVRGPAHPPAEQVAEVTPGAAGAVPRTLPQILPPEEVGQG